MSNRPYLLFLHGVGAEQSDGWKGTLSDALTSVRYPGLDGATVVAPKYPNSLKGVDDNDPLPRLTIKAPTGEAAKTNRRDFERRENAIEVMLGPHDRGKGWFGGDPIADGAIKQSPFEQAANYLRNPQIRAHVLTRILKQVPRSGRIVIVGHSLGSVIAADLVRRLPAEVEVVGMVTIGSPLANAGFHVEGLRGTLKEPPANLGWWVNFWNPADPVTTHRGLSSVFPWMTDYRIHTQVDLHVHDAVTYLKDQAVATAIGHALYGSRSKELAVVEKGVDIPLDYAETFALMALRYGYLTKTRLEGAQQERFANALRHVQAQAFDSLKQQRAREGSPLPATIAGLAVDLSDPDSVAPAPDRISHLSKEDAVVNLTGLATANVIRPFEIDVSSKTRQEALVELTIEMGLGSQFGRDVITAGDAARKAMSGDGTNWVKWAALGAGAAALVAATGGLALAAAPGVFGAAAITSALAAFGPGGMIGGLLTAGALVSAGGGGVAIGIASPTTTVETVEAVVSAKLTAAILRKYQGLEQDPTTWASLVETGMELRRERARLEAFSDESAPTLKELKRKLKAVDRALTYLDEEGIGRGAADAPDYGRRRGAELLDRATEAFRSVDLDGDGVPDKSRARSAVEDASSALKGAAAGTAGAAGSLLRRRRAGDATPDDHDPESADAPD